MSNISLLAPDLRRIQDARADMVVLFRFAELKPLVGVASLLDWRLLGHLSRMAIDGFLSGERGETLLMPMGDRMAHKRLLVLGLGDRRGFGRAVFESAISQTFETAQGLKCRDLVLSLPGRAENRCEPVEAAQWFLSLYESAGRDRAVFIVDSPDAHKAMAPFLERWRLKRLIP